MSMHLFSTPVECHQCGTVVDDPKTDHCPQCNALLRERRTPRRLAGVEKRYGSLRFLLGAIRFLGVITILVGVLVFIFGSGEGEVGALGGLGALFGSVLVAVAMFAVAAFFEIALDVEENSRASFRLQQLILEEIQEQRGAGRSGVP